MIWVDFILYSLSAHTALQVISCMVKRVEIIECFKCEKNIRFEYNVRGKIKCLPPSKFNPVTQQK